MCWCVPPHEEVSPNPKRPRKRKGMEDEWRFSVIRSQKSLQLGSIFEASASTFLLSLIYDLAWNSSPSHRSSQHCWYSPGSASSRPPTPPPSLTVLSQGHSLCCCSHVSCYSSPTFICGNLIHCSDPVEIPYSLKL